MWLKFSSEREIPFYRLQDFNKEHENDMKGRDISKDTIMKKSKGAHWFDVNRLQPESKVLNLQ